MKVALAVSPTPVTALARTRRTGSFTDGIMVWMSVDEIRVKVGQNLRFSPICQPDDSQQARLRRQDRRKALKRRKLASSGPSMFTHCRVEFHPLHKPARPAMQRMADVFLKAEDQIEPFREYEAT